MIETYNNIIFYLGYGVAILMLLIAIVYLGLFLYSTIIKIPHLSISIYTIQLKRHISGTTDKSYKRFLKKIDEDYRNYKESKK